MTRHKFVALCGAPGVGKTTAAEMIAEEFGAAIADDGMPLRQATAAFYGFPLDWCFTQAGKAKVIKVCGVEWTVRQLLGRMGKLLEGQHGEQLIPELAVEAAIKRSERAVVFPSCRMNQGTTYRRHGGMVIEITREGHVPINDFDRYDLDLCHCTIQNDGSLDSLRANVRAVLVPYIHPGTLE